MIQYGPAASFLLVLSLVTVRHSEPRKAQRCQFTPLNSSDVIVAHVWSCALYGLTELFAVSFCIDVIVFILTFIDGG